MNISEKDLNYEKKKLEFVTTKVKEELSILGQEIMGSEEKRLEFGKYLWDEKASFDPAEMQTLLTNDELEGFFLIQKQKYFQKLYNIQRSPYFASIIFEEENSNNSEEIYISMTYLTKENQNILYDWRSPICNIFYDYEPGYCEYNVPDGIIKGNLKRKRQYKIENNQLLRVFDNSINIDDELLQEVLAGESSDKMKNIVNTIQSEQNSIIRNLKDKNLIVQGIAGSGKTSVALHRIAFLLYRMENLSSKNVLIFSPNQIFTEYISNILPELGEDNTLQTTFQDYLKAMINEYKNVESFPDFISRYYKGNEHLNELTKYKQSEEIIKNLETYVKEYVEKAKFTKGITEHFFEYSSSELNELLKNRYSKFPIFDRIPAIANKLSETNYNGSRKYAKTYARLLKESANYVKDYKKIYQGFYLSKFCKYKLTEKEIDNFIKRKEILYDDALLLVYLKGLLEGFKYESYIKEVVIDEAQDYNKLQYLIISKIFKKSGFTILGDVNQTVNPYYKYSNWDSIINIFGGKYIELNKSYRSSSNIVQYTNKILGINNTCAIRRGQEEPVRFQKYDKNFINNLQDNIKLLKKKYKSIAVITRSDSDAQDIYENLKNTGIIYLSSQSSDFVKDLVVIPAYMAKGLEFDSVILINNPVCPFTENDKNLLYVAATRAQHELIIYE